MKLCLLKNSDTLICIWILVFPISIIEISTKRKWSFYFISVLRRLRTPKHLNPFSTFLMGRNGTIWKTCSSAIQNAKKQNQLKQKNQVRNRLLIELCLRVWRIILVITWWTHKRQTFTLIWKKIMRVRKFTFTIIPVCKHKEVVSNMHVCSKGIQKMWPSYTFHFSTRILTSKHTKAFNIFSHNICRDVQQSIFSFR